MEISIKKLGKEIGTIGFLNSMIQEGNIIFEESTILTGFYYYLLVCKMSW